MKRKKGVFRSAARAVALAVALAATTEARADSFETPDGVRWEYGVDSGTATLTKVSTNVAGTVAIPATLGGCPVVKLGMMCF